MTVKIYLVGGSIKKSDDVGRYLIGQLSKHVSTVFLKMPRRLLAEVEMFNGCGSEIQGRYDVEYQKMMDNAYINLELGNTVVLAAHFRAEFANKTWRKNFDEKLRLLNVTPVLVWANSDIDAICKGIGERWSDWDARRECDWMNFEARAKESMVKFDNPYSLDTVESRLNSIRKEGLQGVGFSKKVIVV